MLLVCRTIGLAALLARSKALLLAGHCLLLFLLIHSIMISSLYSSGFLIGFVDIRVVPVSRSCRRTGFLIPLSVRAIAVGQSVVYHMLYA